MHPLLDWIHFARLVLVVAVLVGKPIPSGFYYNCSVVALNHHLYIHKYIFALSPSKVLFSCTSWLLMHSLVLCAVVL